MKKINLSFALLAVTAFVTSPMAHSSVMSACKKEMKTFSCKATSDAEAHECLEQHEVHDKKNDGFSPGCYKAHEAFEKKSGKEEAGEKEDESKERKY